MKAAMNTAGTANTLEDFGITMIGFSCQFFVEER
jgi:hypothetical protein